MRPAFCFAALLTLLASFTPRPVDAGCKHCGCDSGCRKVCRLECIEKKVEIVCYGCQSEDFCLPLPGGQGCTHKQTVCDFCYENDPDKPASGSKKFWWTEFFPCGARMHTKQKLMKRTITKKIPSYKWVVEDLCPDCEANLEPVAIEPGSHVPPAPAVSAGVERPAR